MTTIEHRSPHADKSNSSDYGIDPFWQSEMLKHALWEALADKNTGRWPDLRGKSFTMTVHDDGLGVTVEVKRPVTSEEYLDASSEIPFD